MNVEQTLVGAGTGNMRMFGGELAHPLPAIRTALQVPETTPVVATDARSRECVKQTLLDLFELILLRMS